MDNLGEFTPINILQTLIAAFQFLEGLYHGLSHAAVGFLRTADEHELFALGDPLVAVLIIQANADQTSRLVR